MEVGAAAGMGAGVGAGLSAGAAGQRPAATAPSSPQRAAQGARGRHRYSRQRHSEAVVAPQLHPCQRMRARRAAAAAAARARGRSARPRHPPIASTQTGKRSRPARPCQRQRRRGTSRPARGGTGGSRWRRRAGAPRRSCGAIARRRYSHSSHLRHSAVSRGSARTPSEGSGARAPACGAEVKASSAA